jgi:anti-repressor protein
MNELITTNHNENGEIIISGRELHEFLEIKDNYTDWFKRMLTYGFAENVDFIGFSEKSDKLGGRPKRDHHIKLDMAKEIAMIQRNEKGKQARLYFLQLEKMWNSPEMVMKRALEYADRKVLELKQKIELDKPKVVFADAVEVSKNSVLVKDLATLLKQKGIDIGQNRLFEWLRSNGYLCKKQGAMYNKPTQKSLEKGLFELKPYIRSGSNGEMKTEFTPKVTGKGQIYFINKFMKEQMLITEVI